MSQDSCIYRFMRPITSLMLQGDKYRFVELSEGAVISLDDSTPDANGMIHGTYQGADVVMFAVDVRERAELVTESDDENSEEYPEHIEDMAAYPPVRMSLALR